MAPPITRLSEAARKRRNYEKIRYLKRANPMALQLRIQADGFLKRDRTGKFNARGRWTDGHFFPSGAESDRYLQLKELQELGTISDLRLQPRFPFRVNGTIVGAYVADFSYRIMPGQLGSRILFEEVKGVVTPVYRLKRKLMRALYPDVDINELMLEAGSMERFRFLTADQLGVPEKGDRQAHVKVSARKTGRT